VALQTNQQPEQQQLLQGYKEGFTAALLGQEESTATRGCNLHKANNTTKHHSTSAQPALTHCMTP